MRKAVAPEELTLLVISRTGDVAAVLLSTQAGRHAVVDPSTGKSTWISALRARRLLSGAARIIYAPQNFDTVASGLKKLLIARIAGGMRAVAEGFSPSDELQHRDFVRASSGRVLNQALAPFANVGLTPLATRAEVRDLIALSPREQDAATGILEPRGSTTTPVALYAHAKDRRKRWPLDRFASVCRLLARSRDNVVFVLFGGPDDRPASVALAEALAPLPAVVAAGRLSMRESFAALSGCSLFVGNDGAPMHLAALAGVPTVGVFCDWEPAGLWEPIAAPRSAAVRPPPNRTRLPSDSGIDSITVDDVLDAVDWIECARPPRTRHAIFTTQPSASTECTEYVASPFADDQHLMG